MFNPKKGFDGFKRAIRDIIAGIVVSILLKAIILQLTGNKILAILGSVLVFALALIILYENMEYWGVLYLIGWISGIIALSSVIPPYEIALDLIIASIYLYTKISNKFNRS